MRRLFHNPAIASLLRLAVPPTCAGCGVIVQTNALCAACWPQLHLISKPFCEKYAVPFSHGVEGQVSPEALAHPPPWCRARAAVLYGDLAAKLVQGLKYSDRQDFAPLMAQMMAQAGRDIIEHADMIVPVPLHWKRHLKRRYNQSALLARLIARSTRLPFAPRALQRARATPTQVGQSRRARLRNVQGAFAVQGKNGVAGKNIVLVDDVMTSGSTLFAATQALQKAGAAQVNVLVFARVSTIIEV